MQVALNLASEPFGGKRAFWTLVGVTGGLLTVLAIVLVWTFVTRSDLPEDLIVREAQIQAELAELAQAEAQATSKLNTPLGVEIIDRSTFLNQLLLRKGISWTRTFADVEKVLPPDVRAVMIRPEVAFSGTIQLDMTVGAKSPDGFIELLLALEESELFGYPNVRGSAPPTENNPSFSYQLTVSYEQEL
jgi:hypothetical protein